MSQEYTYSNSSWATLNDLYDRFGEEYIDKLSIRNNYDESLEDYVADESRTNMIRVQLLALDDARDLILNKVNAVFKNAHLFNTMIFPFIKQWHIKLTIGFLKRGGECSSCIEEFDENLKTSVLCSGNVCLEKRTTFFYASEYKSKCDRGCR